MNVSMNWLKEYVTIDNDVQTFADKMTMSGSNVDRIEKKGEAITDVVIGKVLEIVKHPDADKLVVTQVDVGEKNIQIVTGAENMKVGDLVPVALPGANLAEGLKIKEGRLRGIASNGMMCSVEELGLDPEHFPDAPEHGIYIIKGDYPLGSDAKPVFGLDDAIIEFEITSNRPDCFSLLGIAREAAATVDADFHYPEIHFNEVAGDINQHASVEVVATDLCPRFVAKVLVDVDIKPSPKWMQDRLRSVGIRPINNLVDITNFVMVEMGQPMHAYDLEELIHGKIIVRRAKDKEKMMTLDGEERELDDTMLVIAGEEEVIGVAGVMGGEGSKVKDHTGMILLEAANFDPASIRKTSKKIGLRTDASTKFEKHLDPNTALIAMERACQLAEMIGAGRVMAGIIDVNNSKREPNKVAYNVGNINRLLGTDISEEEMVGYFKRLEFVVNEEQKEILAPTFRADIECEADLAEEVARLYGYDLLPTTLATGTPTVGKKNFTQRMEDLTRQIMEDCSLNEAMTYSFESPKVYDKLKLELDSPLRVAVKIDNPLGEDFSVMRTSTVNGMLQALSNNYAKRNEKVGLYEIGTIYEPKAIPLKELPKESQKLTIGMYGDCDFFKLKGILETLFEAFNCLDLAKWDPNLDVSYLHPGRKAKVLLKNKDIGYIGEVHPDVLDAYDIHDKAYIAVIDMKDLIDEATLDHKYTPVPRYPAVNRDLAMLVKEEILVGTIEEVIRRYSGKILEKLELFDVYKGKQIEAGYKSVAYALSFRAADHTLQEKEISKTMEKILKGLENELGATLRK
ncbi:MAG: phenylalanine--tRNA ligase subunit beta [Firmicutes bacterium HGW-Firmicutes-5]|nr:MAG: phenylalanine--tRNA ligase subunit beta [Firmicutes bacterium HGW-Firmicutes-5]